MILSKSKIIEKIQLLEATGAEMSELKQYESMLRSLEKEERSYELTLVFEDKIEVIAVEGYRNATILFETYKRIAVILSISFLLLLDERGTKVKSKLIK